MRTARITKLFALFLVLALAAVVPGLANTQTASADYGNQALWQIAISENCDNPSFCQGLGGFWGWAEFDAGGTGEAQLTGCGHLQAPSALTGAQHFSSDGTYTIMISPIDGLPHFFIVDEMVTFTGHNGGPPVTVHDPNPPYPSDTGIVAMPGHYNTMDILGFQAPPGVSFQVQVVQLPH